MSTFIDHFTQHVGISFARQLALSDYLGECRWQVDVPNGIVTFEDKGSYPIQVLGSESDIAGTWLWAWANAELVEGMDEGLLRDARRMRAYGQEHYIDVLTDEEFDLNDRADGHMLAQLAVEVCGADCYYRGPYEDGAGFFLLYDVPLALFPLQPVRITTVISQVISIYSIEHQPMIRAFLVQQGFTIREQGAEWHPEHIDGRALHIRFDEAGRVTKMSFDK